MSDSRGSSSPGSGKPGARRAAGVRRSPAAPGGKTPGEVKGTSRTKRNAAAGAGAAGGAAARSGAKGGSAGSSSRTGSTKGTSRSQGAATTAAAAGGAGLARAKPRKNLLNYPRAGKKGVWRWFPSLRMIIGAFALLVIAGVSFAVWMYKTTDVPEPSDVAVAQSSRVYFADGTTEMGKFSQVNRTIIPSDEIPDNVKEAVVASEDSTFYENRGVSPRGIVRALVNNLSGNARQGGSTITMQYVERYYTGTNTSYWGKAQEAMMALKADQSLSKDEILSRYLNTIYFGRGAYGVQEASQAYFGKDAKDLTDAEASLLVAVIPAPSVYDPAKNPERAASLWDRVIERQVNVTGTLTADEAEALEFPATVDNANSNALAGPNGYLIAYVKSELKRQGFDEDDIDTGGYTIVSTIDPAIQQNTVDAIEDLPDDRPANNRIGTITIDPSTGAIKAMYGGADYVTQSYNDASQSRMQAGSIFKTFTLVAALEDGYSLNSRFNGNSPRTFDVPGDDWRVKNFSDVSYGSVTLTESVTHSINTAFAELNLEIGPERTRDVAIQLGLPEDTPDLDAYPSNVLGSASPTVLEMGEAYATIAAQGDYNPSYMVKSVTNPDGSTEYEHEKAPKEVLDEGVAINATVALQGPPSTGSARYIRQNMDGRPVAGKTGTSESFRSAWFVGFTPQLVTAVGMFQPGEDGSQQSLTPFGGVDRITGGSFPTQIWTGIMKPSLEGQEKLDFPEAVRLDNQRPRETQDDDEDEPSRTTQAPATEEPTTQEPTEEPSEEPTEEPSSEAPTTEEPSSEAPATEEPSSEAPTSEAPTSGEPEADATEESEDDGEEQAGGETEQGDGSPGRGDTRRDRGQPTDAPTEGTGRTA
ncbi:carboxypeptidase [Brachybacterium phenoliresistens]|uniref:Carboxypeptidase n=1 Tax=Brachybacterium phenoliresistens TaxID=396014 RepID=Z9JNT1_9MICO|nr:transglycosylase domain-containing protein [Brachybacterium phenoliresistens]EWS79663.1 carboxypeptidase [Brachybacterium phenoliresistens]